MNSFAVAMAGLHASLHTLRIMANRGLVSPEELDQCCEGIMETLENSSPELVSVIQAKIDPLFAEMKQFAAKNWPAK